MPEISKPELEMFTGRRPRAFQFSAVLTPAILGQAWHGRKIISPISPIGPIPVQLTVKSCVLYSRSYYG